MPVSGPLSTAGLSRVRLVLPRPVVASIVVVRLHRPRDSSTLGLSQLKLLGTTTFREASRVTHESPTTDHTPHRARYLHHWQCWDITCCITKLAHYIIYKSIILILSVVSQPFSLVHDQSTEPGTTSLHPFHLLHNKQFHFVMECPEN